MKTDALSDIRARLLSSLEMSHVRLQLILWTAGYTAAMAVCILRDTGIPKVTALLVLFASVMFLPFLGFWLIRAWRIFQSMGEYVICSTELTQPRHAPLARGMFTFCGVIETEQHGRFLVETHAIFAGRGVIQPLMEDYIGRTVTIAWNRETDMVVVIG